MSLIRIWASSNQDLTARNITFTPFKRLINPYFKINKNCNDFPLRTNEILKYCKEYISFDGHAQYLIFTEGIERRQGSNVKG